MIPHGQSGMHDLIDDILQFADEGDMDSVKRAATDFRNLLEGHDQPPNAD